MAKSHDIGERALVLAPVREARRLGLYSSVRNEVHTEEIFERLRGLGKEVYYPRVGREEIEFVPVRFLSELTPGRWGILEPQPSSRLGGEMFEVQKSDRKLVGGPAALDVIIVPGVAFDLRGYRIGFGKGYYDRTLRDFRGVLIGFAYDFQVVREVPAGEGDLVCDHVVTEKRLIAGRPLRKN